MGGSSSCAPMATPSGGRGGSSMSSRMRGVGAWSEWLSCWHKCPNVKRPECRRGAADERHQRREGLRQLEPDLAYFMTGLDGERSHGCWRVTSVEPPRSLEFTDGFAHQDGTPNVEMPTTAVRMHLTEREGGTRMELWFIFDSRSHMEQLERWGAFEVFPRSVGQMDALLELRARPRSFLDTTAATERP